ncbi:unnamed protein product [Moneuplotes crassus]|uniref:Uncharacterized protein n=1 Tax=Euplotes crassus TaxID=5936 RepID=A0AAD1XDZ9_EUPCR|nr:unnamed protein product [Moneuplotes crassus]
MMQRRFFSINHKKIPAIISDIHGVIIKKGKGIQNTKEAIERIKTYQNRDEASLPFFLLSNGGGTSESSKAESLNKMLGITNKSLKLTGKDIILASSPFRYQIPNQNQLSLIFGGIDSIEMAEDYGFKNYLLCQEYSCLFPYLAPTSIRNRTHEERRYHLENLRARKGLDENIRELSYAPEKERMAALQKFPVHSAFVFHYVMKLEESLQILSDLAVSPTGYPGLIRNQEDQQKTKIFVANPESITYTEKFAMKRIGQGSFLKIFQNIFQLQYGFNADVTAFGKPGIASFDYCSNKLEAMLQDNLGEIYMIGDSLKGDIQGANNAGWKSILVKSGDYSQKCGNICEEIETLEFKPTYIAEDFSEAVDLIFKEHLQG